MDRIDAMRSLLQVVDCGSITRAAAQLDLHKSTVSQHVQWLEARLGVRLLARTTRAVAPTQEGLAYCQHARAILQQVDAAEAALHQRGQAASGHLRVNVPVALGQFVFAPALRGFLDRHPKLTLDLGCSDRTADLVRDGIDCAVRGGPLPDSGLVARRVGLLHFVLCAAPPYLARHGPPALPAQLAGHRQVGYRLASTGRLRPVSLERGGQRVDVDVPARLLTTDSAAALAAALDGMGLIVLASFVAAPHLDSGALQRVLPGWTCPPLPLHLVTTGARRRAARVQVFMNWAQALLLHRLGEHLSVG